MLFMSMFVMLLGLSIAALWSPAGKGMASWLLLVMLNCVSVTFLCGILGQVWNLIVSIPDLCCLLTFFAVPVVLGFFYVWTMSLCFSIFAIIPLGNRELIA